LLARSRRRSSGLSQPRPKEQQVQDDSNGEGEEYLLLMMNQ